MNDFHHALGDLYPCKPACVSLSHRQQQVLDLLVSGYTNQQIADEMGVTFYTVSTHVKNLYRKLGVRKRTDAVVAALASRRLKAN